jgi:thioredoxin-related protein
MRNIILMLVGIAFLSTVCTADESLKGEGITWVKYDEGLALAAKTEKMIFIDFYTDWCKFCHKMDRETFSDKEVIDYFNDTFIAVKIDGDSRTKMKLPQGEFSGRELSRMFGVRGYPTYWFLKPDGEKINYTSGYSPPQRFLPLLKFVGGRHYENMTFKEFLDKDSEKK